MTKLVSLVIFLTFSFSAFSFGQTKSGSDKSNASLSATLFTGNNYWLTPQKMTPLSFLETMKIKPNQVNNLGVVTMVDSFPNNWLTKKDIDTLITLIYSKEKCNCFLNPLSSYIPNDSADVGGYAIALIKSYQQNKRLRFGLYSCPKTNKVDTDKIIQWWTRQSQ